MATIYYLMNVDWNWIKQRPHFLAEGLGRNNKIKIFYQYRYSRKGLQDRREKNENVKPIYVIPKGDRFKIGRKLNGVIKKQCIKRNLKRDKVDYLWATFPDQVEMIRGLDVPVIYDCMDNHIEFVSDQNVREQLKEQEKELVFLSKIIFCSSEKLISVLCERYGEQISEKICILRNGYDGKLTNVTYKKNVSEQYSIAYFGTISSWFNFDYILKSLDRFPDLRYLLIGPIADVSVPEHERIEYLGTVEHDRLYEAVADVDCLVMPFIVNSIIESVDPVKLYEYINFYKDILCVQYKEVTRFSEFVYFYSDLEQYYNRIEVLKNATSCKYSEEQRKKFLEENTWQSRVEKIEELLGTLYED